MKKILFVFFLFCLLMSLPFVSASTLVTNIDGEWHSDSGWEDAPIRNMILNYSFTYGSLPSWQIPLDPGVDWGVDHTAFVVESGQTLTWGCWIRTSEPTVENDTTMAGGRIGVDVYGQNGASRGLSDPDGTGDTAWDHNTYVAFSTEEWTYTEMSFTLEANYTANQVTHGYPVGTVFVPHYVIVWYQTWSATEYATEEGTAWYANPTLTITAPDSPLPPTVEPPAWNSLFFLLGLGGLLFVLYNGVIKKR